MSTKAINILRWTILLPAVGLVHIVLSILGVFIAEYFLGIEYNPQGSFSIIIFKECLATYFAILVALYIAPSNRKKVFFFFTVSGIILYIIWAIFILIFSINLGHFIFPINAIILFLSYLFGDIVGFSIAWEEKIKVL